MAREIQLTRGLVAIVDDEDFERVSLGCWKALPHGQGWRVRGRFSPDRREVYLHRFIMRAPDGLEVDHINGDALDNRKANLRICTRAENMRNRHSIKGAVPYIGVTAIGGGKRFRATIRLDRKLHHLGVFDTAIEAAIARDEGAKRLHGRFAKLNFPEVT